MDIEKSRQQLLDRLTENYADYQANLLQKDRQELIDDAHTIAGTTEVFHHLTERRYTEGELVYLLNFQNPLEVVADRWTSEEFLWDALDAVVRDIVDKEAELSDYPLAADAPDQKPDGLQKFMDVDLETVFPQIRAQKTAFYQTDLNYALEDMRRGIASDDPAKRNFVY